MRRQLAGIVVAALAAMTAPADATHEAWMLTCLAIRQAHGNYNLVIIQDDGDVYTADGKQLDCEPYGDD